MRKLVCILLVIALVGVLSASLVACKSTPRGELLKIYMPGDYIDDELVAEFEDWYKKETGNNVKVKVETFEKVEDIQRAVEVGKTDYDLLCPSDYMVEYLLKKELLLKVDKEIVDVTEEGLFKTEYLNTSKEFDPTLEYSVPYMYGTLGLVYDRSKTDKNITSWTSLFGNEFSGKRSVKDSPRDAYAAACLFNARESLTGLSGSAQKEAVQRIFEDATTDTLRNARSTLTSIASSSVWDSDDVKFEMANPKSTSNIAVALMWSCDAGYVMNDYEDANGNIQKGNRNLWYVVPEEGGNVYIDCFVISKYAKNTQAANYFLKYLCTKDVAIGNSEYAGAISPVAEAYEELKEMYTEDEDGLFEGASEEWKEMFIETMFPSAETLNRCGVMKDFGSAQSAFNTMWSSVQAAAE